MTIDPMMLLFVWSVVGAVAAALGPFPELKGNDAALNVVLWIVMGGPVVWALTLCILVYRVWYGRYPT